MPFLELLGAPGGVEIRGVGRNHLEKVRSWGWAATSLSGLVHQLLTGVMRGDKTMRK